MGNFDRLEMCQLTYQNVRLCWFLIDSIPDNGSGSMYMTIK